MLETTEKDREALSEVLSRNGYEMPDVKMSIYKNRRTKYKSILVWCRKRLGVCRLEPLFVTNYNYEIIDMPNLKIEVNPND